MANVDEHGYGTRHKANVGGSIPSLPTTSATRIADDDSKFTAVYGAYTDLAFQSKGTLKNHFIVIYTAINKHKESIGIIDDCDIDLINSKNVNLDSEGYARVGSKRLHQLVMKRLLNRQVNPGFMVDHENRNKLDNTRSNLREVTCLQNNLNTEKRIKSGRKCYGSTFLKSRNKWQAQIKINGKQTYLGVFDTEQEAQECYLQKAKELARN